ncbi:hypothetical protein EGW08_009994, partial [Elysia chlorotica]
TADLSQVRPPKTSPAADKPLNLTPSTTTNSAPGSKPKIRMFNVTHLSNNWERRKAEKLAALEREEKAKLKTDPNGSSNTARNENTKTVISTPEVIQSNGMTPDGGLKNSKMETEDDESTSSTPLSQDSLLPVNGLKGNATSQLEQLELLLQENNLEELSGKKNNINGTNAIFEYREDDARPKKEKPADFDIDKSLSDSDPEDAEPLPKSKNKTLLAYMAACARSGMKPNPTFMRQCGRSSIDMLTKPEVN